jgi:hypothetical protein
MSGKPTPIAFKGRSIGILLLTVSQTAIGLIHLFSGLWLLAYELSVQTQVSLPYDIYTVVFGVLVLVFAVYIWKQCRIGWTGTIAVSGFVIIADGLAVLGVPSIPGIPQAPMITEMLYSVWVIAYMFLPHVRRRFSR